MMFSHKDSLIFTHIQSQENVLQVSAETFTKTNKKLKISKPQSPTPKSHSIIVPYACTVMVPPEPTNVLTDETLMK